MGVLWARKAGVERMASGKASWLVVEFDEMQKILLRFSLPDKVSATCTISDKSKPVPKIIRDKRTATATVRL